MHRQAGDGVPGGGFLASMRPAHASARTLALAIVRACEVVEPVSASFGVQMVPLTDSWAQRYSSDVLPRRGRPRRRRKLLVDYLVRQAAS
ncbi:hypothetical protein ACU4GD_21080 [Cupriavidus basilensis]